MQSELQAELVDRFDEYETNIIPVGQMGYIYKGTQITHLLCNPETKEIEVWAGAEEYPDVHCDLDMLDALMDDKHAEQILMSNEELDEMLADIINWI